jgi:uncharacterized protein YyaL (SSP411 family)
VGLWTATRGEQRFQSCAARKEDRFLAESKERMAARAAESAAKRLARRPPRRRNGRSRKDGRATAYVCEDYVCKLPTTDLEIFERQITGESVRKP